jgi:hypothetical protein
LIPEENQKKNYTNSHRQSINQPINRLIQTKSTVPEFLKDIYTSVGILQYFSRTALYPQVKIIVLSASETIRQ